MYVTGNALNWILLNNSSKNVILLRRHAKQTETAGSGKQRFARLPSALCFLFSLLSPYDAVLDLRPRGEPDVLSCSFSLSSLLDVSPLYTGERIRVCCLVFVETTTFAELELVSSWSLAAELELQIDVACKQVPFNEKRSPRRSFPHMEIRFDVRGTAPSQVSVNGIRSFCTSCGVGGTGNSGRFCREFKALTRLYIATTE